MLAKRIIPCLDINNGRTVKGINFENIRDAGDPVELAMYYSLQGADELVFLDITATVEKRKTLVALVKDIASHINIPFTVGGGISSVENAYELLQNGAHCGRFPADRDRAAAHCDAKTAVRLCLQGRGVGEIAHPKRPAADLILIGWTDAAAGGSDPLRATPGFAGAIERAMRRKDQRGVVGKLQVFRRNLDTLFTDGIDLIDERPRVDNDPIPNDRQFARSDDPRRKQAQLVLDIADDERVSGVVAALKTDDDIGALR